MVTLKGTMKHLIKSKNPSSLGISEYNRIILNSATDGVIAKRAEYVDLGLPSGLKWAKCNIGAARETDYGYYFQWAETEPHDAGIPYDWANYKYCNGSDRTLTKYCTNSYYGKVDNKRGLDIEDDAARAIKGGDWRMPTQAEFQELLSNTDNAWVDNFKGTGVNGWKFTSKTNKRKYIFIPASGYCVNNMVGRVGLYGFIWTSSLNASRTNSAWYMYFVSGFCEMSYINRSYGGSVRGVMD